jgi:hypothetical protein
MEVEKKQDGGGDGQQEPAVGVTRGSGCSEGQTVASGKQMDVQSAELPAVPGESSSETMSHLPATTHPLRPCSSNSVSASLSPQTRGSTGGHHHQEGPTYDSSWDPIRAIRAAIQANCPASRSCNYLSSTVGVCRVHLLAPPANVWEKVGNQRSTAISS